MTPRLLPVLALAAIACDSARSPGGSQAHSPGSSPPRSTAATPGTRAPSPRAFTLPERDLLPESIAFDSATDRFYIGSMHRRKIVRRDPDGHISDFAGADRGLWSIIGIKLDPSARELWANSCNLGDDLPMTPADPATRGRGALLRLRLTDGRVVGRYEPPASARPICFNDLALAPAGDVYLTSGRSGLWRLRPGKASLEPLLRDSTLWLNGIAAGADGALYAADDSLGPLLVDPASGRWRRVTAPPNDTLRGIDGLYVHRGALLWVQNGVEPARVVQAPLSDGGTGLRALRVLEAGHPDYLSPTTGVVVGDTLFYVATAQLRAIRPGGRLAPVDSMRENVILKLTIPTP